VTSLEYREHAIETKQEKKKTRENRISVILEIREPHAGQRGEKDGSLSAPSAIDDEIDDENHARAD
jgi:hypothetical protein